MGKGDRRSRRGKIWRGTTGKRRAKARREAPAIGAKVKETKVENVRKVVKRTKGQSE